MVEFLGGDIVRHIESMGLCKKSVKGGFRGIGSGGGVRWGWRTRDGTNWANRQGLLGLWSLTRAWSGRGAGSSRATGCGSQHSGAIRSSEFLLESFDKLGASTFVPVNSLASFIASLTVKVGGVSGVSNEDVKFRVIIQCGDRTLNEGAKL